MPKKGHRTASRQAQLSQRKRRGKGRPQVFDSSPTEPRAATAIQEPATEAEQQQPRSAAVSTTPGPSHAPTPQPARRSGQRATADPTPATYRYLGSELRQIGMITTLIVAILVVLTFVMRG